MRNYLELLNKAHAAPARLDRTGTGTSGLFGPQMEFDLLRGFPILTTKAVWFKGIVHELLWLLSGSTNIKPLVDAGVHIWDEWADTDGELGPVYGKQWRAWTSSGEFGTTAIDQIKELLGGLKNNPFSRRHVVTAWNPSDIPDMALPPCHCLFQFYVAEARFMDRLRYWCYQHGTMVPNEITPDEALEFNAKMNAEKVPTRTLSCKLYQRSADLFLGVPFNIASYALLTHMVAQVTDMIPANFIWSGGDVHLYLNHRKQAEEQLSRNPGNLPKLVLNRDVKDLFAFTPYDIALKDYNPQEAISAPVSV